MRTNLWLIFEENSIKIVSILFESGPLLEVPLKGGLIMGMLVEKDLKNGDSAVLYVTTCSDIDSSFKHSRKFLECHIVGTIYGCDELGLDDRYIVRCAEDIREEPYKGGIYAYEALVSTHSPFLMTWEQFEELRSDYNSLSRWLYEVSNLIMGFNVPEEMANWQHELCKIMLGLGIDDFEEVIKDIKQDFIPGEMEVICFPS